MSVNELPQRAEAAAGCYTRPSPLLDLRPPHTAFGTLARTVRYRTYYDGRELEHNFSRSGGRRCGPGVRICTSAKSARRVNALEGDFNSAALETLACERVSERFSQLPPVPDAQVRRWAVPPRDTIRLNIEQSLRNLQTETIDLYLYYLHQCNFPSVTTAGALSSTCAVTTCSRSRGLAPSRAGASRSRQTWAPSRPSCSRTTTTRSPTSC
jgi:hypothetical protein